MWLNQDTHLHTSITLATNIHKKSTKNIVITHCPKVLLFSLSKKIQCRKRHGLCKKNIRGNKKASARNLEKERKRVR